MKLVEELKSQLIYFIGTCFLLGYFPFASGTVSTLFPAILFYFFEINDLILLYSIPLIYFLGVYTSSHIQKNHGDDPQIVTIDEFLGFCITMIFIPKTLFYLIFGFILFRILDILKPFPINYFDNKNTAHGIMLDDVFAGLIANLILQVCKFIIN